MSDFAALGGAGVPTPSNHSIQLVNVIRGDLADLVDKENLYETQTVSCIESGSTDTSTIGHEDALMPVPGQVFFYLAEYGDGEWSSYGTESAAKPRVARVGDCR